MKLYPPGICYWTGKNPCLICTKPKKIERCLNCIKPYAYVEDLQNTLKNIIKEKLKEKINGMV